MKITQINSGGQCGADIGALDAAIYTEIPHGGYCPLNRKQEKGQRIPDKYQLTELPSPDYLKRTEANVVDSDATLIFSYGKLSGGSLKTFEFAQKHKKPVLHIAIDEYSKNDVVDFVYKWFDGDITKPTPPKNCVLNVAGSRESKVPGIQNQVFAIMVDVISKINGKLFYPIGD